MYIWQALCLPSFLPSSYSGPRQDLPMVGGSKPFASPPDLLPSPLLPLLHNRAYPLYIKNPFHRVNHYSVFEVIVGWLLKCGKKDTTHRSKWRSDFCKLQRLDWNYWLIPTYNVANTNLQYWAKMHDNVNHRGGVHILSDKKNRGFLYLFQVPLKHILLKLMPRLLIIISRHNF